MKFALDFQKRRLARVLTVDVKIAPLPLKSTRQVRIDSPSSIVPFLSAHRDSDLIRATFDVGACGCVLKSDSDPDLILGSRAVLLKQPFVSRSLINWARES
jgi:DNA-binding NarL/FixJ family response regulator